jgi:hypothetical protein
MKYSGVHIVFLCALFFFSTASSGQSKKFLSKLDTNYIPDTSWFQLYDHESFLSQTIGSKEVDVYDFDPGLLNACVFFTLNQYRLNKKRKAFVYSPELEKVAYNYVQIQSSYKFRYYQNERDKLFKGLETVTKIFGFPGTLVDANAAYPYALNYEGKKDFYYDRKDSVTKTKLYYGKKTKSKDKNTIRELIPNETYLSLAKKIVRKWSSRSDKKRSKSRAYTYMACYVDIDERTLNRRRIPQIKAVQIFGGYRIDITEEMEEQD